MNNAYTKERLSLMAVALFVCLCLSFNSVAGTFASASHNMASNGQVAADAASNHEQHANVISARDSSGAVEHANSDDHIMSQDCCDDGQETCLSTSSACAAHCAVSVIDRTGFCLPTIMKTVFIGQARFKRSLSVNLAGPFKPPR